MDTRKTAPVEGHRRPWRPWLIAGAVTAAGLVFAVAIIVVAAIAQGEPPTAALKRVADKVERSVRRLLAPPPRVTQEKRIWRNMQSIGSAADQFMIESGQTEVRFYDIVGSDRYIRALPASVAGEDYRYLFPIHEGFTMLEVSKPDGVKVNYN